MKHENYRKFGTDAIGSKKADLDQFVFVRGNADSKFGQFFRALIFF
jgi:hypothetical protein